MCECTTSESAQYFILYPFVISLYAMYISSLVGKSFPSYPFNFLKISVFIADAASEKKNVFNPSFSMSFFVFIADLGG